MVLSLVRRPTSFTLGEPTVIAMKNLRERLNVRVKGRVIAAPGVYDMVSLRMASRMGFEAL